MRLTDDELRDVLARAEEIQRASRHSSEMRHEVEVVLGAAEEVGLARSAVERALWERQLLPVAPPEPGTLAFATSADGNAYVAEVLSTSADGARVRFLRGSEHVVSLDQLRPCSLIPGERVICNWPSWGPWTCTVVRYDPARQVLELSDGWGSTHKCALSEVWLAGPRQSGGPRAARRRVAMLAVSGLGLGALLGSVITALLMR